jgi:hypothetical protein
MIPDISSLLTALTWSPTAHRRSCELRAGGAILGSLRRTGLWSSESKFEGAHGNWMFRRIGPLRSGGEVVYAMSDTPVAVWRENWRGGGTLIFGDGEKFRVAASGCWRPVWTVLADDGEPILSIEPRARKMHFPDDSHITPDRRVLLAAFVLYTMQQAEDTASMVAVLAATV